MLADELALALAERPKPGDNGSVAPVADSTAIAAKPANSTSELAGLAAPESQAAPANPAQLAGQALPGAALAVPAVTTPGPAASAPTNPPISPPSVVLGPAPVVGPGAPEVTALAPAAAAAPNVPANIGPATRRELAERAWKLHELGNSLPSIQLALETSGGQPDDVAFVMAKLVALEQAREARYRRNVQWAVAASVAILGVLLVVGVLISLNPAPAIPAATPAQSLTRSPAAGTPVPSQSAATATLAYNPIIALINQILPGDVKIANGPSPTPGPTSALLGAIFPATPTLSAADLATAAAKKSGLPAWVSTLVPNGITVLNVPTPSIDTTGPQTSPCPLTSDQASALFGGPSASWSYNHSNQGWILILAANPISVRVPANMLAGYLVIGDTLEMRSVQGPATVHNVNFVAISCIQK